MNSEDKKWLQNWPSFFKQEVILNSIENELLAAFIEDDACSTTNCAELFDIAFLDNNFSQSNYLRDTQFSEHYIPLLSFSIVNNDILKMLRFSGNINFTIFSSIAHVIENHPSLHDIELSANNLDDQAAPIVARILQNNTRIHSFDLGCNNITDAGAQILLEALRDNFSILIFNLVENPISAGILDQINEILERNKIHQASSNILSPPQTAASPAYP